MAIAPGTRIGPYEVTESIGAGGMGEVYRATDTNLARDVAIKVLPESVASDPERLARFDREARTLASLNHPNIAAIYGLERGDGQTALVMELVEGPTLADRIAQGAIPVEEALPIAKQIAEALEAAHEQGIIHRDLKPANIKLRPDGTVKVLDFGLAKAMEPAGAASPSASRSPTITTPAMTQMGMILGTAAYMSPEQARGKPVDKRTDIWAFGVILWEMCAGRQLFVADTVSDTIAAVLREVPDLSVVPARVRRVVSFCLERDPRNRLRDTGDVRLLLDDVPTLADISPAAPPAGPRWLWPGLAVAGVLAAGAMAVVAFNRPAAESPPVVTFQLPPTGVLLSMSPDGQQLLVVTPARGDEPSRLWLRSLDALDLRPVPGSEGITAFRGAAWSPDGEAVVYVVGGRALRRTSLASGQTTTVVDTREISFPLAWTADGMILYDVPRPTSAERGGIWRVPQSGGEPVQVTRAAAGEFHRAAGLLPDGRRFFYLVVREISGTGEVRIASIDSTPEEQDTRTIVQADSAPVYVGVREGTSSSGGYLLFQQQENLLAARFDPATDTLEGEPVVVASGVTAVPPQSWFYHLRNFFATGAGVLAYSTGEPFSQESELLRLDRTGNRLATIGPPALYQEVDLFPDGSRLAVARRAGPFELEHIQIVDVARSVFTRLNPGTQRDYDAIPSSDGNVAYTFSPDGVARDIYVRAANGVGEARLLVASETTKHPNDWSPDARFLIYDDHRPGMAQDLFVVSRDGGEPVPFLATEANESPGLFSPDGRWIAYQSNESGRAEVYVRDFAPDRTPAYGVEKVQISVDGGDKPRWAPDGRALYFLAPDDTLMEVPVSPGRPFEVGTPVELFQTRPRGYYPYDVFPDGTFIVNMLLEQELAGLPAVVVLNWFTELERLVPRN